MPFLPEQYLQEILSILAVEHGGAFLARLYETTSETSEASKAPATVVQFGFVHVAL